MVRGVIDIEVIFNVKRKKTNKLKKKCKAKTWFSKGTVISSFTGFQAFSSSLFFLYYDAFNDSWFFFNGNKDFYYTGDYIYLHLYIFTPTHLLATPLEHKSAPP